MRLRYHKSSFPMHTNRLISEKSPYLLQHAHNPVDWHAWGAEAFAKAASESKPIFLSIGYSTCHWCHVMERESFENERIAELLNRDYVPIKVDREERPDVDRIYMAFVQATTGSGGWPMSVWLTPDRRPFFGGTYFPPENRWGRPGFESILTQIAAAWRNDREQIVQSAGEVSTQLRQQLAIESPSEKSVFGRAPDAALLDSGFAVFRRTFDTQMGGFGGAPKFPRPSAFTFLLRYYARTGNREALEMTLLTLREMAKGGMHDQLGGGFHRYSVDARWFVPHFEKMLYDQAQLAITCVEAFQISGDSQYAAIARDILDYVLRDMTEAEGGFYSAEDADSALDPKEPHIKGEGAFYIWSAPEIRQIAGAPAADWFCHRYGVADDGNVTEDPHGEFTGRNILYQAASVEETAEQFGRPVEEVRAGLMAAEAALLQARAGRVRPHLDDKILASWNGLMISAFALAGAVLDEPRYARAARRAADFVLAKLVNPETGILERSYRQGPSGIPGFLDDYAMFAQALLDLYEAQFDPRDLNQSVQIAEKMLERFEDREHGGFFTTAVGDESLVMRLKDDYDGAEPAGNSVAILLLLRLAAITGREAFRKSAERALAVFMPRLSAAPVALPYMLSACEFFLGETRQIVFVGEAGAADTRALLAAWRATFAPNRVVLLLDSPETRRNLVEWIPVLEGMKPLEGRAAVYVCRDFACQLPVSEPSKFRELLQ
jgi:uncharacterized protein YyaL (SSP411 family)